MVAYHSNICTTHCLTVVRGTLSLPTLTRAPGELPLRTLPSKLEEGGGAHGAVNGGGGLANG